MSVIKVEFKKKQRQAANQQILYEFPINIEKRFNLIEYLEYCNTFHIQRIFE